MLVKIAQVAQWIEEVARKSWAEEWDNAGLQLGDPALEVRGIRVALDFTDAVLEEAITAGDNLIVTHHPAIFKALKSLRGDTPLGRRILRAARQGVAVYSAHTNYDLAPGGINDVLAQRLELQDTRPLLDGPAENLYKIAVFVPHGHADAVRDALAEAGAGWIGNYSHCTFQTPGTGTFMPREGTNPFIGRQGQLEQVQEFRLETIVPESRLKAAIRGMLKAHPYEEVAYDLYPLANEGQKVGLGRLGKLVQPMPLGDFARFVRERLQLDGVRIAGDPATPVQKVAVIGGSGGSLVHKAAFAGADVLVTGDVKHHNALDALEQRLCVVDAQHFGTEAVAMPVLTQFLNQRLQEAGAEPCARLSAVERDPLRFWR